MQTPPSGRRGLNLRQRRFVEEYQVDLNGAQAAIRAGYAKASAARQASGLLRRPDVAAAIRAGARAKTDALAITAERVLEEYARIAFANIADYVRFGPDGIHLHDAAHMTRAATAAIAEATESKTSRGGAVRFKLYDKMAALNALARYLGLGAQDKLGPEAEVETPVNETDAFEIARRIAFVLRQGEARQPVAPATKQ